MDKKPILMVSSHALPMGANGKKIYCKRWGDGLEKEIITTPIYVEYTNMMTGIDVID